MFLVAFLFLGKPLDALSESFPINGEPLWVWEFFDSNCLECHDSTEAEGGLNLEQLPWTLSDSDTFDRWVHLFDRIESMEMPPRESSLAATDRRAFLNMLGERLEKA